MMQKEWLSEAGWAKDSAEIETPGKTSTVSKYSGATIDGMQFDQFVSRLDERLQSTDCTIWRQQHISPAREVALFATRVRFTIVRIPVHLFVEYKREPTPTDFQELFEEGRQ